MEIFIVRHAESQLPGEEIYKGLTEIGKFQAYKTGIFLSNYQFDQIYSSPSLRTVQTAKIIADHINYDADKIIYDNRLTSRGKGILNGKSIAEVVQIINKFNYSQINDLKSFIEHENVKCSYTYEEPIEELMDRAVNFMQSIVNREHKRVLIIGHGVWIINLLRKLFSTYEVSLINLLPRSTECYIVKIVHDLNYKLVTPPNNAHLLKDYS